MTSQQRLAAAAAVLSWVVLGIGCQDQQQTNPSVTSTPDGGSKKPDAAAPDIRGNARDAAADSPLPPTTGAAGTGGSMTTPPPPPPPPPPTTGMAGTGGSATTPPPPTTSTGGTGGSTPTPTPTTPPPPPTTGTAGTGGSTTTPTTPPPPAGTTLRIAAIGDYGENVTEEQQVADLVHGWKPDLVITLGDNNYQSGAASTIDANIGKYYHDFIGSYHGSFGAGSPTNRFWPSPGNHDWVAPNLTPYIDYFTLPNNERYYDVDLGLVHLFAMDSDEHEPDGNTATSKQALWLKDRMTASTACYDLVYFHYPAYSSGDHGSSTELRWPFESWGADAVLSGHDHDYERFQVGGIPYFTNGLGAAGIYKFTKTPLPETKFRYDALHGAMLITATTTGITFEFWSYDGKKIDSITVPKTCR
jgi:hypothetical protein